MRRTESLDTTITMKKTHEKLRKLIIIVKDTNTNNRGDTTPTKNDDINREAKPPADTTCATEFDDAINALGKAQMEIMSLVSTSKANKNHQPQTPHQRAKAKPWKVALGPNHWH